MTKENEKMMPKGYQDMFICECGELTNQPRFRFNKEGECQDCFKSSKYLASMKGDFKNTDERRFKK